MFVGRKNEMAKLDKLYNSNKYELAVLFGRRRVGKTTLITEFCKDKKHIFFTAEIMNEKLNLQKFTRVLTQYFGVDYIDQFRDFETALKFLCDNLKDERLIVVIDEFPYLVSSNKSIVSVLQNMIDHHFKNSKVFFILCGSSISFMEREVLGYKSPLFGRRTYQMEVKPFCIFEVQDMFRNYSNEDLIQLFSIAGGTPHYLAQFDSSRSIKENMVEKLLDSGAYLYTEPVDLLRQELREVATYNSILTSIANGASRLNDIATVIGEKTDKTANYLKVLIELRLVKKVVPVTHKDNSKKGIYQLQDNLFKFYYKFILKNRELLEEGKTEYVYNKIDSNILEYIGHIFEDICIQYMRKMNIENKLPFTFEKIGKWWGTNKQKRRQEEIDIVAYNDNKIILGECKYRNELVGIKHLKNLMEKDELFEHQKKYYFLFSKSGFTDELIKETSKYDNIYLVRLNDIFNSVPG